LEQTGSSFVAKGTLASSLLPTRTELFRNAAYGVAATTFAAVPFDTLADGSATVRKATGVAPTAGFRIALAGRYAFAGRLSITTQAISDRLIATIMKNGSEYYRGTDTQGNIAVQVVGAFVSIPSIRCALNDLIQLGYYCNAGRVLNPGSDSAWAVLEYVGP